MTRPSTERLWIGPPASYTDVLRRCAKHGDRVGKYRNHWYLKKPHGGEIFARHVASKIMNRLIADGMITRDGRLTHSGKKEGLRLAKLYVIGKI